MTKARTLANFDATFDPTGVLTSTSTLNPSNLDATGTIPSALLAGVGGGKVLQVQHNTFTSGVTSVSSTSWTATEITDQITPSSSSSKILVMINVSLSQYEGSGSGVKFGAGIYRNINNSSYSRVYAGQGNSYGGYGESSGNTERTSSFPTTLMFVDEPNTTNTVDYKLYLKLLTATGQGDNVNTGASNQERSITLIEIGA